MRALWFVCGLIAVLLGLIGAALPILPTVPFMLLAVFCFARSSQRLHDWILHHPSFGPPIRDWQETGAITRRAKRIATLSVLLGFGVSIGLGFGPRVLTFQALVLCGVLVFLWTRPTAPR